MNSSRISQFIRFSKEERLLVKHGHTFAAVFCKNLKIDGNITGLLKMEVCRMTRRSLIKHGGVRPSFP
jgi:hypothetical protein